MAAFYFPKCLVSIMIIGSIGTPVFGLGGSESELRRSYLTAKMAVSYFQGYVLCPVFLSHSDSHSDKLNIELKEYLKSPERWASSPTLQRSGLAGVGQSGCCSLVFSLAGVVAATASGAAAARRMPLPRRHRRMTQRPFDTQFGFSENTIP